MINLFLFYIPKCLSSSKFCHFKFMYYKIYFKNLIPQLNRDLKPENIVLKKDENDNIMFKIIDLGYAKDISAQDKATSLVGTWHYIVSQFLLFEKKNRLFLLRNNVILNFLLTIRINRYKLAM